VDPPFGPIADGLKDGQVIPFFGAAASAVYRPPTEQWEPGKPFMPFASELASTLVDAAGCAPRILRRRPTKPIQTDRSFSSQASRIEWGIGEKEPGFDEWRF
jgi:hypothetical protein